MAIPVWPASFCPSLRPVHILVASFIQPSFRHPLRSPITPSEYPICQICLLVPLRLRSGPRVSSVCHTSFVRTDTSTDVVDCVLVPLLPLRGSSRISASPPAIHWHASALNHTVVLHNTVPVLEHVAPPSPSSSRRLMQPAQAATSPLMGPQAAPAYRNARQVEQQWP